jgi:hypothetical protein
MYASSERTPLANLTMSAASYGCCEVHNEASWRPIPDPIVERHKRGVRRQ